MIGFDVHALAADKKLETYDTALPLDWYNDVHEKIGVWPQSYGFVWGYDKAYIGGEPIPLTEVAEVILTIYNHVRGVK